MKNATVALAALFLTVIAGGCTYFLPMISATQGALPGRSEGTAEAQRANRIVLSVNDTVLDVAWLKKDAVRDLRELLKNGEIVIRTERYGGFEQVGTLPVSLTASDQRLTALPGDIMLYSGNSVVLFYGSNTWSYTLLGSIQGLTQEELETLLGGDSAVIRLSLAGSDH